MTYDESGGEPASAQPGVTLKPEQINYVSYNEVDSLTRWHFGWTLLGSVGGIVLSAGLCRLPATESEPLTGITETLLWVGSCMLALAWGGFWIQVWWRKRDQRSGRPVDEIKFADSSGGSTP